jgi:hypothetical protein
MDRKERTGIAVRKLIPKAPFCALNSVARNAYENCGSGSLWSLGSCTWNAFASGIVVE